MPPPLAPPTYHLTNNNHILHKLMRDDQIFSTKRISTHFQGPAKVFFLIDKLNMQQRVGFKQNKMTKKKCVPPNYFVEDP